MATCYRWLISTPDLMRPYMALWYFKFQGRSYQSSPLSARRRAPSTGLMDEKKQMWKVKSLGKAFHMISATIHGFEPYVTRFSGSCIGDLEVPSHTNMHLLTELVEWYCSTDEVRGTPYYVDLWDCLFAVTTVVTKYCSNVDDRRLTTSRYGPLS